MSGLKAVATKSINLVTRRSVSSGVVRVVKPVTPVSGEIAGNPRSRATVIPLMHRVVPEHEKAEKVPVDVRIADIFRQYNRNPRDKDVLMSVLQNLSTLGTPAIVEFPGFIHLVSEMSTLLSQGVFTYSEVSMMVNNLRTIGVVRGPYEENSIDFLKLGEGLSDQLVSLLDSAPPSGLFELVSKIQVGMKVNLDRYFYWAFTKAMLPWAKGEGISNDQEYVKLVLGNLQLLTSPTLFKRAHALLDSVEVQSKIVDLIHRDKLSVVLLLELLHNIQPIKESLRPVIQAGIDSIVTNHPARLEASLQDLATVLSLSTGEHDARMAAILKKHFASKNIPLLLQCVADMNPVACDEELVAMAAKLVTDNISVVHTLPPNRVANLYYLFAKSAPAACAQLESLVVGRLPAMAPAQLSKLVLAFASGTNVHVSSFKALQGTVRRQIDRFGPNEFAETVYGLAYAGLLTKSVLLNAGKHVSSIRRCDLPRFLWALAVANHTVPVCWEIGVNRLTYEVLSEPQVLESLTTEEEVMIYETLVAFSVLKLGIMPGIAQRRRAQFESKWVADKSNVDYASILTDLGIEFAQNDSSKVEKMLQFNILIPRHKLVLDVSALGVTHPTSGATMGSAALRHMLWASRGFNVVAISDDRSDKVETIIGEFAREIANTSTWNSRRDRLDRTDLWDSRTNQESGSRDGQDLWDARNNTARPTRRDPTETNQWDSRRNTNKVTQSSSTWESRT